MSGVTIKLDMSTIQKIALFESITKTNLKDCIMEDDEIIFVVGTGYLRKALGKKASNVRLLEKKFGKKTLFIEFNHDPKKFAENILRPIQVKSVDLDDTTMNIIINSSQRAFPNKKVKKTKKLLKKYFSSIENVNIRV